MPDEPRIHEAPITDLIPADWQSAHVWISSYRMFRVTPQQLADAPDFEVLGVKGHFEWGTAPYFHSSNDFQASPDGSVVWRMDVDTVRQTEQGPFLILMTPTEGGRQPGSGEDTDSRIRAVLALARLCLGRNAAASHLGHFIFHPSSSRVEASITRAVPGWDPQPDLSNEAVQSLTQIDRALNSLDTLTRNRLDLSLQWCYKADTSHGVDSFLMYWIALEALAMPGSEKLDALETALGAAYGIGEARTRAKFGMGRLYGLRGKIVHVGVQPSIHARLLEYMAAVHSDLLLHKLGLRHAEAADYVLANYTAEEWMPR